MRIDNIELSWFRGAAENGTLDATSKSIVVYGANGSGKSTFSDAIEYIVGKGKIKHLQHEYSGRRQEKAVRNTHTPDDKDSTLSLNFQGGCSVKAEIAADGTFSIISEPDDVEEAVQKWELERLILRQDEVANFVHATKGDKYSVLLPLLGLEGLEQTAINLHKLKQCVDRRSGLTQKEEKLTKLTTDANQYLSDLSEERVIGVLKDLAGIYLEDKAPREFPVLVEALEMSINAKIESVEPEYKRHLCLKEIHDESLLDKLTRMTKSEKDVQGQIGALLDRRIAVLEEALAFAQVLERDAEEIECPACGQVIVAKEFINHVHGELHDLKKVRLARDKAKTARRILVNSLQQVCQNVKNDEISTWLVLADQKKLYQALIRLSEIDLEKGADEWSDQDIATLNEIIPIITSLIKIATDSAQPPVKKLINDLKIVKAGTKVIKIKALNQEITRIQLLVEILKKCETAVRDAIKSRTKTIIRDKISDDIQSLWSKLHPNELIEDVELYIPGDADKAIDIGLKFFGVAQLSPRLTLSEGHRNSLGLCIYLALACLDEGEDRPIFLDDVISSFDREHRGMLVDILLEDFAHRQVLLFTHDREWFTELRMRSPPADWKFMVLRPWESPGIGLQWSTSEDTFDDARALISVNTEAAGNCVRRIMDTTLPIAAENLRIPMPYLRGDRNDRRTCIDFLVRITSEATTRLRKKDGTSWLKYSEPLDDWKEALNLLIPLANRASHTGSLTATEVNRLIEVCETALSHFQCPNCNNYIWIADQNQRERLQCACGDMQWRYRKSGTSS